MAVKAKKYDPNGYDFGRFAETMNNNYALERAQNNQGSTPADGGAARISPSTLNGGVNLSRPINLGGATNSRAVGNSFAGGVSPDGTTGQGVGSVRSLGTAERYRGITSDFKSLLGELDKGKPTSLGDVALGESERKEVTETQGVTGVVAPSVNAAAAGASAAAGVVASPTDAEATEGGFGGGGTVVEESTLPAWLQETVDRMAADAGAQVESGADKLDFETWQAQYSVDPVKEYQAAQRQLDYEIQTWMSNYGARAEQLYQAGLSDSGVSDIYGANAYSAYVQSSVELKRAQIEQQQENRRLYQQYVDQHEADKAARTEAANNRISSAFTTFMDAYTPETSEAVYSSLLGMNMSESEALRVIRSLNDYYESIPEDQRSSALQSKAAVANAYDAYKATYYPALKSAIEVELRAQGMSEEQISSTLARLDSFYNATPVELRPDEAASSARVNDAFTWLSNQYDAGVTDLATLKARAAAVYGDDVAAAAAEKLNPFATSGEADGEALINDAATIFAYDEDGNYTYTGDESQREGVRQLLKTSAYSQYAPYVEEIIAKMDENLAANKRASSENIVKAYQAITENQNWLSDSSTSSLSSYIEALNRYKKQYGISSEEYENILKAASSSVGSYILKMTNDEDMLEAAGEWLGAGDLSGDASDKLNAALEYSGELHKNGYLTDADYEAIIDDWFKDQLELSLDSGKQAFYNLSSKAGRLYEYYDEGYMSEREYDEYVSRINRNVRIVPDKITGTSYGGARSDELVTWIKVGEGEDKVIKWRADVTEIKDPPLTLKMQFTGVNHKELIALDDELFYRDRDGTIYSVNTAFQSFTGDGKANTAESEENMTLLIKAWIKEKSNAKG